MGIIQMTDSFFPREFLTELRPPEKVADSTGKRLPRISIVMPSYNQARFIERSILSVLNQGYPNLQFIVIDGGSSDGTVDIIKKYEPYIDYWVSEPDKGQSDALNKGFQQADGEILGWLNSDDLYLQNALHNAALALVREPEKRIAFGDWLSINEHDEIIDYNFAFDFSANHFKYEGFHLNAQSMLWRKEVHGRFTGFAVDLYNTMDYQMILEFGVNEGDGAFERVPTALGAFRRYAGQKTGGVDNKVMKEHAFLATRYGYEDKYSSLGKIKRLGYRFRRAYWYTRRGGMTELMRRLKIAFG